MRHWLLPAWGKSREARPRYWLHLPIVEVGFYKWGVYAYLGILPSSERVPFLRIELDVIR